MPRQWNGNAANLINLGDLASAEFLASSQWSAGVICMPTQVAALASHFGKWGSTAGTRQIVSEFNTTPRFNVSINNGSLVLTGTTVITANQPYLVGVTNATGTNGVKAYLFDAYTGALLDSLQGTHPGDATLTQALYLGARRADQAFNGPMAYQFYMTGKSLSVEEYRDILRHPLRSLLRHRSASVAFSYLFPLWGVDSPERDMGGAGVSATITGTLTPGGLLPIVEDMELSEPFVAYTEAVGGGGTDYPVTVSDGVAVSDTSAPVVGYRSTQSDGVVASDSTTPMVAYRPAVTDGAVFSDQPSASPNVSSSDYAVFSDSLSVVSEYTAGLTDGAKMSDSPSAGLAYRVTIGDTVVMSENFAIGVGTPMPPEGVRASDTLIPVVAYRVVVTDGVRLSDQATPETGGQYSATASDGVAVSDSVSARVSATASASEVAVVSDALSVRTNYAPAVSDIAAFGDALEVRLAIDRLLADVANMSDSVSALTPADLAGEPSQIATGIARPMIWFAKGRD